MGIVIFAVSIKFISSINKLSSFLIINFISSIAILTHEAYFFYSVPSFMLLYVFSAKNERIIISFFKAFILFIPTISTMIICISNKGDSDTAQLIHYSWQKINYLIPTSTSISGLKALDPMSAIGAIGWDFKKGLSLSLSTLYQFKYKIIWTPLFWNFIIFLSGKIFIGDKRNANNKIKLIILIIQLISITPLFVLGWDFGRWIFLWLASSIFLTKEFIKFDEINKLTSNNFFRFLFKKVDFLSKGYQLKGSKKYYYLFITIPICCWSLSTYIKLIPIFYLIQEPLEFIYKIIF